MAKYKINGLVFDVTEMGPATGETIVLLHGFPQAAESWSSVASILAEAGYRVVAPNQRGYSPGARPVSRFKYRLRYLADDIASLMDKLGVDKFHLVGHDWGGGVAWVLSSQERERILSLTVLSTPHPKALLKTLMTTSQIFLSWYLFFFQIPRLPEWIVLANNGKVAYQWLKRAGLDDATARTYVQRFLDDPEALTGAVNWYRAMPFDISYGFTLDPPSMPTTFVWSDGDIAVSRKAAEATARLVGDGGTFRVMAGESHWLPEQAAREVAATVLSSVARISDI
jgi:pimeloyl-ACP methyl ester carboxylesterase